MKKIILLLQLVASSFILNAQNHPPFPSVEDAMNLVKTKFLVKGSSFEKEYGIKDLSKVKVQKTEEMSYFSAYASDDSYSLFPLRWPKPQDRCHVLFLLVTPPESDGTYYEVTIDVVYSRIKNNVLTNTWEFYWFDTSGAPTVKGGKNATPTEKINLLVNTLKNIEFNQDKQNAKLLLKNGNEAILNEFEKHYSIDSIGFTEEYFSSKTTKEWYFTTKGKIYSSLMATPSRNDIKFMNAYTKIKMVLTQNKNDWEITDLYIYPSNYSNEEKYNLKSYSGMICEVGFEGILFKTTPFNPHYKNNFVKNEHIDKIYKMFINSYLKKGDNYEEAFLYFNPKNTDVSQKQAQNFLNFLKEINQKCVEIYKESDNQYDLKIYPEFESDNKTLTITFRGYRPNCFWDNFNHYKKIYKDAGMSASLIKTTGGMFDLSIELKFTLVAIDNILYIDTFDDNKAKSIEIPF